MTDSMTKDERLGSLFGYIQSEYSSNRINTYYYREYLLFLHDVCHDDSSIKSEIATILYELPSNPDIHEYSENLNCYIDSVFKR